MLSSSLAGLVASCQHHDLSFSAITAAPPYSGPVPPYTVSGASIFQVPSISSLKALALMLYVRISPEAEVTVNCAEPELKSTASPTLIDVFA